MPGRIHDGYQPWFTIDEFLSTDVTAGEVIDTERITAVSFSVEVNITIGALTTAFVLPVGVALGIDCTTKTISVDADAFMFVMGGKDNQCIR